MLEEVGPNTDEGILKESPNKDTAEGKEDKGNRHLRRVFMGGKESILRSIGVRDESKIDKSSRVEGSEEGRDSP
jgi:hypothetical protein